MINEIKTSVRLLDNEADTFEALAHLLGKRPHELAVHLVRAGLLRYSEKPEFAPAIAELVTMRRAQVADLSTRQVRHAKGGLTLLSGGAS